MKKKNKVIILSSVLATGAIAATAAIVPSVLKNKGSKVNNTIINTIETKDIKNPIITNKQEEKLPPVVTNKPTEESFRKFELSFEKLNEESKGKASFYFENTNGELYNKVLASFDDKVYFKVQMNDKSNLTLTDLRVYVNNNEAWSLGVYHVEGDQYMIQMPSEDSDWAKELTQDSAITFKAYFGPAKINDWVYHFNSRTYAMEIKEEGFVFDDVKNEGHRIVALEGEQTYIQPTQFRVYLNNFNIKIRDLTIPKGTQLMFINQPEYSNTLDNRKAPIIDLEGGYRQMNEQLKIEGAVGRYGDVEYSKAMQAACGLPVILDYEDMDWDWINKVK
ncbi:MAG: hypothetical protein IKF44_02900 [Mycoplasmataceae bacterium]|nr:hypothetical protein [Mycoplasmataceae bacterium]